MEQPRYGGQVMEVLLAFSRASIPKVGDRFRKGGSADGGVAVEDSPHHIANLGAMAMFYAALASYPPDEAAVVVWNDVRPTFSPGACGPPKGDQIGHALALLQIRRTPMVAGPMTPEAATPVRR